MQDGKTDITGSNQMIKFLLTELWHIILCRLGRHTEYRKDGTCLWCGRQA